MDWFLYDNSLRHERVKSHFSISQLKVLSFEPNLYHVAITLVLGRSLLKNSSKPYAGF